MTAQKKALMLFGLKHQLCKLAEECAELAAAALCLSNAPGSPERLEQFCEEVADVEIMIEPMRDHFGAVRVDAFRASKLKRLEKMVLLESAGKAESVKPEPAEPKVKEAPPALAVQGEDFISLKTAALLVGKAEQTIRNAIYDGRLESRKEKGKLLVSRDDVLALKALPKGPRKQPA